MRVQPLLLRGCDPLIGVYSWSVLDLGLVVCHADVTAGDGRVLQWDEALRGAEEAGLYGHKARLAGRVVYIDLTDTANLLTVGTDDVASGGRKTPIWVPLIRMIAPYSMCTSLRTEDAWATRS